MFWVCFWSAALPKLYILAQLVHITHPDISTMALYAFVRGVDRVDLAALCEDKGRLHAPSSLPRALRIRRGKLRPTDLLRHILGAQASNLFVRSLDATR